MTYVPITSLKAYTLVTCSAGKIVVGNNSIVSVKVIDICGFKELFGVVVVEFDVDVESTAVVAISILLCCFEIEDIFFLFMYKIQSNKIINTFDPLFFFAK